MKIPLLKRKDNIKPLKAKDGALVYELFKKGKDGIKNIGLASGILEPLRAAFPHYHKISEEIYYIASGKGKINAGKLKFDVSSGDAVYIPTDTVHSLENTSPAEPLHVLCISSPPYAEDDFISAGEK